MEFQKELPTIRILKPRKRPIDMLRGPGKIQQIRIGIQKKKNDPPVWHHGLIIIKIPIRKQQNENQRNR